MQRVPSETSFGSVTVCVRRLSAGRGLRFGDHGRLSLVISRRGALDVRARDRAEVIGDGGGVLAEPGALEQLVARGDAEVLVVSGPAELATDIQSEESDGPALHLVSRESAFVHAVAAFAQRAASADAGERTRLGDYYIERLMQEMLQGLIAGIGAASEGRPHLLDPYRHALAVVKTQYGDAGLTVDRIAAEVRLSPRQLAREFANHQTTIRGELRRIRLEHAVRMLCDPDYRRLSIDQIARHVGFSGSSSLARAMADSGLPSPSTHRSS